MDDLRERIAEKKAAGLYAADDIAADLRLGDETWDAQQLERAQLASQVVPGLITSPSDSPIVGKALGRLKEQIVRASWRNMADLADQLNRFHAEITAYTTSLGAEVRRLRRDVGELRASQDGGGLAALESRIDRLAELTSGARAPAATIDLDHLPKSSDPAGLVALLGRELASARGAGCLIGCGAGELLDALGTGFTGVDDRADLVAAATGSGRAAVCSDPRAYLAGRADGTLGAVVIRELAERVALEETAAVVRETRRALGAGGAVAIVVRNHASAAERETFWRDPWRLRPVEPETIAALVSAAGFSASQTHWVDEAEAAADESLRPTARCAVVLARVP